MKFRSIFAAVAVFALIFALPAFAAAKGKPTPPPTTPSLGVVGTLNSNPDGISLFGFNFAHNDLVLVTVTSNEGISAIVKERSDNDGNLYGDIYVFPCADVATVSATDSTGGTATTVPAC